MNRSTGKAQPLGALLTRDSGRCGHRPAAGIIHSLKFMITIGLCIYNGPITPGALGLRFPYPARALRLLKFQRGFMTMIQYLIEGPDGLKQVEHESIWALLNSLHTLPLNVFTQQGDDRSPVLPSTLALVWSELERTTFYI